MELLFLGAVGVMLGMGIGVAGAVLASQWRRRRNPNHLGSYAALCRPFRYAVGIPLEDPREWVEPTLVTEEVVRLADGTEFSTDVVRTFAVAFPDGRLLHAGNARLAPPRWAKPWQASATEAAMARAVPLAEVDLEGEWLSVRFQRAPLAGDRARYTLQLRNRSPERVRIVAFGAYEMRENLFVPSERGPGLMGGEDFAILYGVQRRCYLEPGEAVRDPQGWTGRPLAWIFHGETESGEPFLSGGIVS